MIVVSDASPLIALSAVGRLDLLRELFGSVLIPAAVYAEVVQAGAGLPGANEVGGAEWITSRTVGNTGLVKVLGLDLDRESLKRSFSPWRAGRICC